MTIRTLARTLTLALVWAAWNAAAQPWPQFRGDRASGVVDGRPVATQWNGETGQNVLWHVPIAGLGLSSPIVWGDRVFVSTAISARPEPLRAGLYGDVKPSGDVAGHEWKLMALDPSTGMLLWERTADVGVPRTLRHPKSSQASSTPVTDGAHVVVLFGSQGLFAYDWDGELLWKRDLGVLDAGWFYDPDYAWGHASSPIIYESLVIVQCDRQEASFIAAFDVTTGQEVWRTRRDELPSWGTPNVFDDGDRVELVTHATRFIRGYDPRTGEERWRLGGNSEITVPTPVFGGGLILVSNGYQGIQPIYAIRPGGSGDISLAPGTQRSEWVAWSHTQGGPYIPTPIVYGDYLYIVSDTGILTAYRVGTGEQVYRERIVSGVARAVSASPVASNGRLYIAGEDGDVWVVRAGPEFELLATNTMGEVLMATPAISDGVLFIRGLEHLFAIANVD